MSSVAIRVANLSKLYRIGPREPYRALRDTLSDAMYAPFRRLHAALHRASVQQASDENTIWALKDVSFEVKPGEVVGIIGRNGAGKSTLLKILSRITEPTAGQVDLYGRVGSLLEVGTGFHPELTGRENMYLNGAILGMKKTEINRQFDAIVSFAEIEKFIDTPVKRYSSGMYVRLAFAVAAHMEPEILLVDEVLAVGDYEFQKKCLGKMKDVSEGGRTVLFVSHNLGSVSNLCARAVWLDAGQIVLSGDTREVVSGYIASSTKTRGEISWPDRETAPGNENVRLKSVKVMSDGIVTSDVLIDKPIAIQVEYWNLKEGIFLVAGIELRDKAKNFVLASNNRASANLSVDKWYNKPLNRGIYRTCCMIPENFLNNEYYSVDIGLANKRNEWEVRIEDVISFVVHETGAMTTEYAGRWVGVVRPKFSWSTEQLEHR